MAGPALDTYKFGDERLPSTFWRHLRVAESGCWEWTGSTNHAGYGRWSLFPGGGVKQTWRVHRLTFHTLVRPLTPGMTVDHLCRVRRCCNPGHLDEVTQRENTLRGDTLNAANVAKTHCPRGHAYDTANTYVSPKGRRNCRACKAGSQKRMQARPGDVPPPDEEPPF